jgi:mitotic spindle assembly checkpoint protein MAD1
LDSELSSARNTVNSLQEELADIETDYGAFTHESQKAALQHQAQISAFERRVSQLEQELRQTQNLAEERLSTIHDLRNRCEELESQQDSVIRQNADQENMQVVRDELHRQADYLRSLENTNAKLTREVGHLRDKMVNIEVLREEKRGLERKAIELEEMRDRVIKLEAVVEMTRQEREKWFAHYVPRVQPLIELTGSLATRVGIHSRTYLSQLVRT